MKLSRMPDIVIKSGTTTRLGKIEGVLRAGRNATITAEQGQRVVVTKGAYFDGPFTLNCDFECQSMRVEGRGYGPGGDVHIHGNLTVHETADLNATVKVDGEIKTGFIDVGGHLESRSITAKRVRVGGHLKTKGNLQADIVDVGGHMTVSDAVQLGSLRVGGHAEVGGGRISGEIRVRGHLTTTRQLTYGHLEVFGNLKLPAGCTGDHLSAIGNVEFDGDATCRVMEVTGAAKVRGSCAAEKVKVNGRLDVSGPLLVSQKLEVYGATNVKEKVECDSLEVGGKLTAETVSAATTADIAGDVETTRALKASSIVVGKGAKVAGAIVGEQIRIGQEINLSGTPGRDWRKWHTTGRMSRVGDLYGNVVQIGAYSSAKHVYGEVVEMEEGSIAQVVTYTREVRLPQSYHLGKAPAKVTKLPPSPL